MTNRLFLLAAYDSQNIVGPALAYYVLELSKLGDVVLFMDNDMPGDGGLEKISGHIALFGAERHSEYDFGSYKRAYAIAKKKLALDQYKYCYLLNDSVYGPLFPLKKYMEDMEALNKDAFGMVFNPNHKEPHLQSWFIGMNHKVFTSSWFENFLNNVKAEENKIEVCRKYENGLTNLLCENNSSIGFLFRIGGKKIYNNVKSLYNQGLPFIKKNAFIRHNGSLCNQLQYILSKCEPQLREAILDDANRLYGPVYVSKLLSATPLDALIRYMIYLSKKVRTAS